MSALRGLHHVTCIAGDPQENLNFYAGVLGMRLVKRSVNQDDPGTYHLFYADAEGNPGTDLTFFPWPHMGPGRPGPGLTVEVALAVPTGSLAWWADRLMGSGERPGEPETRFGEPALPFTDPHGLPLSLVETENPRDSAPWSESPVPNDRQIRGLHAVRLLESDGEATIRFLVRTLGFEESGVEGQWRRFGVAGGGSGAWIDIREVQDGRRGAWGMGSVHHVAWRVPGDETQLDVRRRVELGGLRPTPVIDRFWFRSVYFREPGGALFEVATDGPGFTVDEEMGSLGEKLVLPPWLEPERPEIERLLPSLQPPPARSALTPPGR